MDGLDKDWILGTLLITTTLFNVGKVHGATLEESEATVGSECCSINTLGWHM